MSVEFATDGLGLAIMKEIACQHGELVWVTSLVNKERRTFFSISQKSNVKDR
jgi:signal transduction histidine kinase